HTRSKRDWSSDVCSSDLYLRDRNEMETNVTVEARDRVFSGSANEKEGSPDGGSPEKFGLHAQTLSSERARHLGMQGQRGVIVSRSEERRVGKEGSRGGAR